MTQKWFVLFGVDAGVIFVFMNCVIALTIWRWLLTSHNPCSRFSFPSCVLTAFIVPSIRLGGYTTPCRTTSWLGNAPHEFCTKFCCLDDFGLGIFFCNVSAASGATCLEWCFCTCSLQSHVCCFLFFGSKWDCNENRNQLQGIGTFRCKILETAGTIAEQKHEKGWNAFCKATATQDRNMNMAENKFSQRVSLMVLGSWWLQHKRDADNNWGKARCLWMGPCLGSPKHKGATKTFQHQQPLWICDTILVFSGLESGSRSNIFAELITQASVISMLTQKLKYAPLMTIPWTLQCCCFDLMQYRRTTCQETISNWTRWC